MPQRRVAFPGAWGCMYAARWQRLFCGGECCARAFTCLDWAHGETLSMLCDIVSMHLRRGHLVYKLAAQAVCVVHWFNPAAWLLRRMMSEACGFGFRDRAVARRLDGAAQANIAL